MIRSVLYAILGAAGIGEFWVIWCVAASVETGAPFPPLAGILGGLFVAGYLLAWIIFIGIGLYRRSRRRRSACRLGIIRIDRDGNFYYTKK